MSTSVTDPMAEPTVEQLLAAADELDAAESLTATLDAIRHTVVGSGISVTVDLHGKLVGLVFDQQAMKLGARALAVRLRQLTQDAAVAALADGVTALAGHCDQTVVDAVTAELARLRSSS